jgi:hypothetical protein
MTGLDPTTVAQAAPVIAAAMGLAWPGERMEVLKYLNDYRNMIFNMPEGREIFSNVFHCICLSEFTEPCGTSVCSTWNTFNGFSLPADVSAVVAVFDAGDPMILRSRWRESRVGMSGTGIAVSTTETARQSPVERDIKSGTATRLKVRASHAGDANLLVTLRVIDADWQERTVEFTLLDDQWASAEIHVREIRSVALPVDRKGEITLAQEDGYELSIYDPWERVPSYRRFKVAPHGRNTSVLVQGIKQYRKVWFDHDIVEVGDSRVIQHAGRFFKHGDESTEAKDLKRAMFDKVALKEELAGVIGRHRGRAIQDSNPARGRRITRSTRLPGYR